MPTRLTIEQVACPGVHHGFYYQELQSGRTLFGHCYDMPNASVHGENTEAQLLAGCPSGVTRPLSSWRYRLGEAVAWQVACANQHVAATAQFDGGAMYMPADLQTF